MRKHGHSAGADGRGKPTPEYASWCSMRRRCLNPDDKNFKDYGARGIGICKRWGEFENFLADMGRPPLGATLERINNDRGYAPKNCKWATRAEQARNKRNTKRVKIGNQSILLKDAEKLTGITARTIAERLNRGWTEAEAIRPVKGQNPRCKRGHAYADTGFYLTKRGHRVCRLCACDNAARYMARKEKRDGTPARS